MAFLKGIDNPQEMILRFQQEMRFLKRESEHRSFIRAYLFDYIFKTFIQLLDECISQRERLVSENKEEWEYFSTKK